MERRGGGVMDRVPHDYQNIVPDFRGDGIAFPSDQAGDSFAAINVIRSTD